MGLVAGGGLELRFGEAVVRAVAEVGIVDDGVSEVCAQDGRIVELSAGQVLAREVPVAQAVIR